MENITVNPSAEWIESVKNALIEDTRISFLEAKKREVVRLATIVSFCNGVIVLDDNSTLILGKIQDEIKFRHRQILDYYRKDIY